MDIVSFQNIPEGSGLPYLALDENRKNIGIYLNSPSEIEALEIIPPIVGWFEEWYGTSSRDKIIMSGMDHKAIPFITWEPVDISFQDIIDGKHDEYLTGYFTRLALICPDNDILMRFAHEMEMRPNYAENWYSWQGKDSEIFKQAWIHLVEMGRRINKNIKWVWSPNRADEHAAHYYPGDKYVDYVGITLNLPEEETSKYDNFKQFYEQEGTRRGLEEYGKKIIISEVACSHPDIKQRAEYLESVFDYIETDDQICAVLFFNDNKGDNKQYNVTENESLLEVIKKGIRNNEKSL